MSTRRNGFTLIEMLVATVLLSIVMGSVYTLFHSVIRSWRAVEQDCDIYQDARAAITLFRHEAANIAAGAGHLFEGEEDEVTMFVVSEPLDLEDSEGPHLMRVRYRFKKGDDELLREEALVETALPKVPPPDHELDRTRIKLKREEEFVVASGVRSFSLTYLWLPVPERFDPKMPPDWIDAIEADEHRERWGLPQGIEMHLELYDPGDPEKTLELTATVPVRAPTRMLMEEDLREMLGDAVI